MKLKEMVFDFEISTLNSIKEFNNFFSEIKKRYPNLTMPMIRAYLKNGIRVDGVPNKLYDDLDKLSQIRMEAIKREKIHIIAQTKERGVALSEDIISGESLIPFFDDKIYEKVPTLRVYEYLSFYSPEEIAQMTKKPELSNEARESEDDER